MPITSVTSEAKALTLTIVGEYPVRVERLVQMGMVEGARSAMGQLDAVLAT